MEKKIDDLKDCMVGNKDDLEQAIKCLDDFTHNWCMNCTETERTKDIVFRCGECLFSTENGKCLVKIFKYERRSKNP